jgi:hypothetical protein
MQVSINHSILDKYALWFFGGGFCLLNWLIFLPIYLFHSQETSFWPLSKVPELNLSLLFENLFAQRENLDIFRLNLEFSLLVLLWLVFKNIHQIWFLVFSFTFYVLQIIYAIYEGFIRSYYLLEPFAYNDFSLLMVGSRYVVESMNLSPIAYLSGTLLAVLIVCLLLALHRLLFNQALFIGLGSWGRIKLVFALILSLLLGLEGSVDRYKPEAVKSSFIAKIAHNVSLSQDSRTDSSRFSSEQLFSYYGFTQYDLAFKPNIHIIFVESYGSVLYKREDYNHAYERLLLILEEQLSENGWQTSSSLSNAPTWGGGSWISYTSFLFGLPLESHSDYLHLLRHYQGQPFPHMINYFRSQGYYSYRITSSSNELVAFELQRLKQFFGVDEWLRFEDIIYEGPLYGWGPSIPDQYALNFGIEKIKNRKKDPYTLFFITQNSHYPWYPLPKFTADWQRLNETPPPKGAILTVPHEQVRERYLASIEYVLTSLVDLILSQGDMQDIFIIIGDHQPARVARYSDGWDTPIHIISQDSNFVSSFESFGFVPGLLVGKIEPTHYHSGFYSLFSHALLQHYGADVHNLPEFRPQGVNVSSYK